MTTPSVETPVPRGGIRPPAVAGQFYPAGAAELRQQIWQCLGEAPADDLPGLKVAIVPHAGYIYSGPTAGRLYASLRARRAHVRRVVLLGPTHRVALDGIAVPQADHWATPLGRLPIDRALKATALALPGVVESDLPHAREHALEVQLPFLQSVLGNLPILPLAVGRAPPAQVAALVDALWGGPDTLFILSTDLSHYLPADAAEARDHATVEKLLACVTPLEGQEACGAWPANGLLTVVRQRGLALRLLDYRHSGDTAGDRERVVGYAAIAALDPQAALGDVLLRAARGAIEAAFGGPGITVPDWPVLRAPGAVFVTLTRQGRLRGCIGSLAPQRGLLDDVLHNARAAAFNDPRFPALSAEELDSVRVEVSRLSAASPMTFVDEADLLRQLRPGIDGLILSEGAHRATFLPQVWAQLPDPAQFLGALKQKAGLSIGHWTPDIQMSRYTVEKWIEPSDPASG